MVVLSAAEHPEVAVVNIFSYRHDWPDSSVGDSGFLGCLPLALSCKE
jgi:hypothetical protein